MKTSIITIMTLMFSLALNAQITHEHTYNFSGTSAAGKIAKN